MKLGIVSNTVTQMLFRICSQSCIAGKLNRMGLNFGSVVLMHRLFLQIPCTRVCGTIDIDIPKVLTVRAYVDS